jgi:hypothetical protein
MNGNLPRAERTECIGKAKTGDKVHDHRIFECAFRREDNRCIEPIIAAG